MKSKFKKILNLIAYTALAVLLVARLPLGNIKNAALRLIDNVNDFISDFNFTLFDSDNDSSDNYINNITFNKYENEYFVLLEFKVINAQDLEFIKINNVTFTTFIFEPNERKKVTINISSIVDERDTVPINITTFKVGKRLYESTLSTTYYKDVDYNLILERQQSIVGISTSKTGSIFEVTHTWGSGIIFNKKEIITTDLLGRPSVSYEYLILTNYHVIENGVSFKIHYGAYGNEYPKSYNDRVELMGYYKVQSDLAILKLTTRDGFLVSLEDEQFTTKELVPIENRQLIFAVGSPSVDNVIKFNTYKIGKIINTEAMVGRLKDSDLCIDGCLSIQSSTYQGEGSSGGGVFDLNGNLIGVHFAGNSEHKQSFEIPMSAVLIAIDQILGPEYILKRGQPTSFFILPDILHQKLLHEFFL